MELSWVFYIIPRSQFELLKPQAEALDSTFNAIASGRIPGQEIEAAIETVDREKPAFKQKCDHLSIKNHAMADAVYAKLYEALTHLACADTQDVRTIIAMANRLFLAPDQCETLIQVINKYRAVNTEIITTYCEFLAEAVNQDAYLVGFPFLQGE